MGGMVFVTLFSVVEVCINYGGVNVFNVFPLFPLCC